MMEVCTLLVRLDGPMQAWGTDSRFSIRETRREPTKSGVVGLVAAAMGRERSSSIDDISSLSFGVRVDREGRLLRDFHTAGKDGFYRASGSVERRNVIVSERFYLADACFTVGLQAHHAEERALLESIEVALRHPVWPLYLGRRAFPLAAHPALGKVELPLLEALRSAPSPPPDHRGRRRHDTGLQRYVLDADAVEVPEARRVFAGADMPLSFLSNGRRYATRETVTLRFPAT